MALCSLRESFFAGLVAWLFFGTGFLTAVLDNGVYLLYELILPNEDGVIVIRTVWPPSGPEAYMVDVEQQLFQGLAVLLVHGQQEAGKHDGHHEQRGHLCTQGRFYEEVSWEAQDPGYAKTDQLPLREIERDFGFNL